MSGANSMDSSSIELRVISGKDLKAFNFFQKLSVYALVSIVSDDPGKKLQQPQQQKTPTDTENDGDPEWNHQMHFDLREISFQDIDHLFIHFALYAEVVFGEKLIGEVHVPIKDMIDESRGGIARFLSYEIRSSDGKSNGVLTFSCKVNNIAKDGGNSTGSQSPEHKIDGFSIVNYPDPSAKPEMMLSGFGSLSSSKIDYPSLDWNESSSNESYSLPSPGGPGGSVVHTSHEVYPPPQNVYPPRPRPPPPPFLHHPPPPPPPPPFLHHPPPPPPPPFLHHPPPPPPMWGGGAYDQPQSPTQLYPWPMVGVHVSGAQGSSNHGDYRDGEPQFWNGR